MAKSRLPGGAAMRLPQWPWHRLGVDQNVNTLFTLDSSGDRAEVLGCVRWADGGTHDIHQIVWRSAASTGTKTVRVGLADVDAANGPPGRDDGTVDQSGTHSNPAANTNFTTTLGADRTNVAHGTLLAVRWDFSAYTSGTLLLNGVARQQDGGHMSHRPQCTFYNGSAYSVATDYVPCFHFVAADGTLGVLDGCYPQVTALTTHSFGNGTNPDERGLYFTVSQPMWLGAAAVYVGADASSGNFDIVIYDGTTALVTISVDANTLEFVNDGPSWLEVCFADQALVTGHTYRIVIKPTTAGTLSMHSITLPSAAATQLLLGLAGGYCTRNDGGAFTDTATELPFIQLGITAIDDAAGGGGSAGGGRVIGSSIIQAQAA